LPISSFADEVVLEKDMENENLNVIEVGRHEIGIIVKGTEIAIGGEMMIGKPVGPQAFLQELICPLMLVLWTYF
jgi:hypothetical protein